MKKTIIISLVLAMLCPCVVLTADEVSYLPYIDISRAAVSKTGDNVGLTMTVDMSALRLKTQHTVALIPVIVSKDGVTEAEFPPIVIDGKTRSKVYYRAQQFESVDLPPYHDGEAQTIMLRDNGEPQSYDYSAAIPYSRWMLDGRLEIREEVHGCVNCEQGRDSLDMFPVLPEYVPDYRLAAIEPEPEPVKTRIETRTARINFRQDSHNIRPDYKDNKAELAKVQASLDAVKENRDLDITGIYVTGYASPEAPADYNLALSDRRAKALMAYVQQQNPGLDKSLWHAEGRGEDWEGLRKVVEQYPNLLKQDEVLKLIDRCEGDLDACEEKIKALVPPEIYQRVLNEMYGPLRRNEYRIEYNVRHFDLSEAKELLKTRPDLLSVAEIQKVADSYGQDTPGYREALRVAVETYPDNAVALTNYALSLIAAGEYDEAVRLLASKAGTDGSLQNLIGVAQFKAGRMDEAQEAFQKAAEAGYPGAQDNVKKLQEARELLGE